MFPYRWTARPGGVSSCSYKCVHCRACPLKPSCCPREPTGKIPHSIHEEARDKPRKIAQSWQGRISRRRRKKIEILARAAFDIVMKKPQAGGRCGSGPLTTRLIRL